MTAVAEPSPGAETEHHDHPGTALYWKIGGILAVLTALEVSTYWWPEGPVTSTVLIIMMVIKFAMVAMYFMHLKFDSRVLRSVFLGGVLLATGIYIAALSSFTFWSDSGIPEWSDPPRAKPLPPPPTEPPPVITGGGEGH
jgi:cytochrome c oxidase subunit 4